MAVTIQHIPWAGNNVTNWPFGTGWHVYQPLYNNDEYFRWDIWNPRFMNAPSVFNRYAAIRSTTKGKVYKAARLLANDDSTSGSHSGALEGSTVTAYSLDGVTRFFRWAIPAGLNATHVRVWSNSFSTPRATANINQLNAGSSTVSAHQFDPNGYTVAGFVGPIASTWVPITDGTVTQIEVRFATALGGGFYCIGIDLIDINTEVAPSTTVAVGSATRPGALMFDGVGGEVYDTTGIGMPSTYATSYELATHWWRDSDGAPSYVPTQGAGGLSHLGISSSTADSLTIYTQSAESAPVVFGNDSTPNTTNTLGKTASADMILFEMGTGTTFYRSNTPAADQVGTGQVALYFDDSGFRSRHRVNFTTDVTAFTHYSGMMLVPADIKYFQVMPNARQVPNLTGDTVAASKGNALVAWGGSDGLVYHMQESRNFMRVASGVRPRVTAFIGTNGGILTTRSTDDIGVVSTIYNYGVRYFQIGDTVTLEWSGGSRTGVVLSIGSSRTGDSGGKDLIAFSGGSGTALPAVNTVMNLVRPERPTSYKLYMNKYLNTGTGLSFPTGSELETCYSVNVCHKSRYPAASSLGAGGNRIRIGYP